MAASKPSSAQLRGCWFFGTWIEAPLYPETGREDVSEPIGSLPEVRREDAWRPELIRSASCIRHHILDQLDQLETNGGSRWSSQGGKM
eukprot:3446109-Pyramimonas_sp.AAC.3